MKIETIRTLTFTFSTKTRELRFSRPVSKEATAEKWPGGCIPTCSDCKDLFTVYTKIGFAWGGTKNGSV